MSEEIFISYKSERRAVAEYLADILEDYGYTVWFDYRLAAGKGFDTQIEEKIRASKCVLVLWCSLSVKSQWVQEEAFLAKKINRYCPAYFESVDLPFGFQRDHTINISNWDGAPKSPTLNDLLIHIGALVGRAPVAHNKRLSRLERGWRLGGGKRPTAFETSTQVSEQSGRPDFAETRPPETTVTAQTVPQPVRPEPKPKVPPKDDGVKKIYAGLDKTNRGELERFIDHFDSHPIAETARSDLETLIAAEEDARLAEFIELTEGYDLEKMEAYIEANRGTPEAWQVETRRQQVLANGPDKKTRKQWELEAAVSLLTGKEIPNARKPCIWSLNMSALDDSLFEELNRLGVEAEVYVDPEKDRLDRRISLSNPTGLDEFVNLKDLNLTGWSISDLSSLACLTALQTLDVSNTKVSDLSPLAGLTALQKLGVSNTQVSDLSPLSDLYALQTLYLRRAQFSDLSPLAGLTALQILDLGGAQVSDLSPLAGLSTLQKLNLNFSQVFDLSPLAGLTALQELHLIDAEVSDLSPLAGLTALQELYVDSRKVTDLSPLSDLYALQILYLGGAQVSDLSPLAGLSTLQTLFVCYTQVFDLSPLKNLTSLKQLNVSKTKITDLSPVSHIEGLEIIGP